MTLNRPSQLHGTITVRKPNTDLI